MRIQSRVLQQMEQCSDDELGHVEEFIKTLLELAKFRDGQTETEKQRHVALFMEVGRRERKILDKFKAADINRDGVLRFDEFFALLKRGNPYFSENDAAALFKEVDTDGGGDVSGNEFMDYIYNNKSMEKHLHDNQEVQDDDEEIKQKVLGKSLNLRTAAASAAKARGQDWHQMTWKERLEEIREQEILTSMPSKVPDAAEQTFEDAAPSQLPAVEELELQPSGAATMMTKSKTLPVLQPAQHPSQRNHLADMTQEALVNYSIHQYDLHFAGRDPEVMQELVAFKEHLKTAGDPTEVVEVQKYLAKGTAGWVFQAENKKTGRRVAMKIVRMTQALSSLKEWYVSKLLRKAGVVNVVLTEENVCVLKRDEAIDIIGNELQHAGPVPYYVALFQEFMNGGSLDGLIEDGRMTPQMMFKALEDISSTLAVMHAHNVQHKDIKPENALLEMQGDKFIAAKLCDFGMAGVGSDAKGKQDDVRRFGVTMFSLATGEMWTKNRLIHEKHDTLVARLKAAIGSAPSASLRELPEVLKTILSGQVSMQEVAQAMSELRQAYEKE